MIELYLAILLFGVGTYFGRNTKKPVMKNMESIRDSNSINSNSNSNSNYNYNSKKPKNLIVYSKSNQKDVIDLEKEYGEKLDSKCREILPRDFTGLLNHKSQKEYEKRKLTEVGVTDEINNEILKYEPKDNKFITSKLTGENIQINSFTKSSTVGKDGNTEDNTMNNWALPYFGGKATQSMKVESFQNKLETFTGASKFNYHKKEIKPLFVPNKNISFTNGTPIYDDNVKNRFVKSNYRNTELPFEQQKVARGVGQNYGSQGTGGFHQFEIQDIAKPKNVDELRSISNPKTTYKQPVLSGKGISGRSANVNVKKHRPDKFYTNSPSRYFKTTGANLKDKAPETFVLKNTGRSISRPIVGSASPNANIKPYKTPNFKRSTRNNYINSGLRNLYVSNAWNEKGELSDYGKKGIRLGPNERDTTQNKTQTLNLVDSVKAIMAPLLDRLRKTRKENIIGNPNPEGYINANVPNKQTLYDPNDVARTTVKETTLHESGDQNVTYIKKQTIYDPNDVAKTTIKETTLHEVGDQNITYINKQTIYDPNDIAKTTIKETTIHNEQDTPIKGPIKITVYDPNDIARTTLKETTLYESGDGNLRPTRPEKSPNYDIDAPKSTIKETTIDNIHHTNLGYSRGDGYGYMTNEFDAPATQKQYTSDVEYGGNVNTNQNNQGGYLSNEYDAPATLKQFTSDNEYTGTANSVNKATQDYGASKNMITTASKENIAKGRSFTQHGSKQFNGEDYMNVLNKKQNATINYQNQSNVSKTYQKIPGKEISKQTNRRVPLSNIPDIERTNPKVLDQLNSNPFAISINRTEESVIETDYTTDEDFI
jgi:hypothetical protein